MKLHIPSQNGVLLCVCVCVCVGRGWGAVVCAEPGNMTAWLFLRLSSS
jgi:hypothetical protein